MIVKELLGEYKDDEKIIEIYVQKPDGELDFFIHNYAAFNTGDIDDCLRKFGPRKVKDSIFEKKYDVSDDLGMIWKRQWLLNTKRKYMMKTII